MTVAPKCGWLACWMAGERNGCECDWGCMHRRAFDAAMGFVQPGPHTYIHIHKKGQDTRCRSVSNGVCSLFCVQNGFSLAMPMRPIEKIVVESNRLILLSMHCVGSIKDPAKANQGACLAMAAQWGTRRDARGSSRRRNARNRCSRQRTTGRQASPSRPDCLWSPAGRLDWLGLQWRRRLAHGRSRSTQPEELLLSSAVHSSVLPPEILTTTAQKSGVIYPSVMHAN